jgi:hypothetical protein
MKKIILFTMVLLPFMVMAKFYRGSITLTDDKTIKAYISEPIGNDSKIKFRYSEDGKTEKIEIEEVKSFEFYDDNNNQKVYHTMLLSNPKFLRPSKFKISKKKYWVKLIKEGKINLYEVYTVVQSGRNINYIYNYYITQENDTYGRFLFSPMSDVFNRIKYKYAGLDYYLKLYYETKCPEFVKSVKYEILEKYGIGRIVDLYEANCDN